MYYELSISCKLFHTRNGIILFPSFLNTEGAN